VEVSLASFKTRLAVLKPLLIAFVRQAEITFVSHCFPSNFHLEEVADKKLMEIT
jgi:hypothetical protein